MQPKDVKRLHDIKRAIEKINVYMETADPVSGSQPMAWDAVLYNFAIIGEAVKALSAEARSAAPDADWGPAARMRDFVIHQYPAVDQEILLATIERDLPRLRESVEFLLAQTGE